MGHKAQSSLFKGIAFVVLCVVVVSGYFAIKDLAGEQSQQQSISPVFALIEKELLQPLHTAKVIADIGLYEPFFASNEPNADEVVSLLASLEEKFGHAFYLAHEASRKQYNSDGRVFDLVEGEVIWYFILRDEYDSQVQAVLGKREDVHLFIDVRQYDEQGNFRGFAGLGKSLPPFLKSFNAFREEYGHEFIFVNNRDDIVLSSIPDLSPTQALDNKSRIGIKTFSEIYWHAEFEEKAADSAEPSVIVEGKLGDLLISRLQLESLSWNLYVVTPLSFRQQEVNRSYGLYIAIGILISFIVYKLLYYVIGKYIYQVSSLINKDDLTNLANRKYGRSFFNRMRKEYRQMSVILCDLDDFKKINDVHGHAAGDKVLRLVADTFTALAGSRDLVVRWGGEEFVLILTDTTAEQTEQLAQSARKTLETLFIEHNDYRITLTGSFGLYISRDLKESLDDMIEYADKAMYEAKSAGKNRIKSAYRYILSKQKAC
ncbi:MAG: diguanylate cyclase (GGDEF)-like protein [Glaciecola sp.]|jgi:diguanylate cyclase (GGDEF)-like protein